MLQLLIIIVVVGLGLYLVETYVPLAPPFKVILRVVAVLAMLLYLLRFFNVAL